MWAVPRILRVLGNGDPLLGRDCVALVRWLGWPDPFPAYPEPLSGASLQAKSQFKRRSTANNVEIHIPVPNDADSPKFKTTVGSVKWVPENSEIVWSIKSFPVSPRPAIYP